VKLVRRSDPKARDTDLDAAARAASDQLVGIIDVLLGLTLVEGALAYRSMFTQGSTANVTAILAMALVYYTAVRSFIDWHLAMVAYPYRVLTECVRTLELGRVLLDFVIMASYSFLILRGHVLIGNPGSDLTAIAITYPAVYFAYLVWGELLKCAYGKLPFKRTLLFVVLLLSGVLLAVYLVGRGHRWLGTDEEGLNIAFLSGELILVYWFRHKNWSQQMILED
jgi:hypothetical protein